MIESNDPLKLKQEAQARARRRKSAGWKSGLMLTGLGAVVAGAGYLAGVNAPAVSQSTASPTVARAGVQNSNTDNQLVAPSNDGESNGDESQAFQGNSGTFQFRGDDDSSSQFNQQPGGSNGSGGQLNQQFGRRNRQFRGSVQQQPGFGSPLTRSRGS